MQNRRFLLRRHDTGFDLGQEIVAVPEPGPGEVVVRMRAVALNKRDGSIRNLSYGTAPGADLFTPLSDGAGEIVAVGPDADWRVGDRVASCFFQNWADGPIGIPALQSALGAGGLGTFTDHALLKATGIVPLPEDWSFEEGATLGCSAVTAWTALSRLGQVKPGEKVLVIGTGGVAIFAVQIAVLLGAEVTIISSSDDKLERARALGATHLVNYVRHADWEKQVRELTSRGVDHAVELGGPGTLQKTLASMALGGHVALIGTLTGFGGDIPARSLIMGSLRLGAVVVGSRADHVAVQDLLVAKGQRPVIDQVFGVEEAERAYARLAEGAFGKVVIRL